MLSIGPSPTVTRHRAVTSVSIGTSRWAHVDRKNPATNCGIGASARAVVAVASAALAARCHRCRRCSLNSGPKQTTTPLRKLRRTLAASAVGVALLQFASWLFRATLRTSTRGVGANAAALAMVPSISMFLFSLLGLRKTPPKTLTGAMQHFAGGIIMAAVAQELVPPMVAARGLIENVAVIVGFFLGVIVLILVGLLVPTDEGGSAKEEPSATNVLLEHGGPGPRRPYILNSRAVLLAMALRGGRDGRGEPKRKRFPTALLTAIAIDGSIDGLLVGISTAASQTAGALMAASLAVEMSFLGLTLATSLAGQPKKQSVFACLVTPVLLVLAACGGGSFATFFAANHALKTGLLSFGAGALLFMVTEELLLEAHEEHDEHIWWVDMQFYVGFACSLYLAKFFG